MFEVAPFATSIERDPLSGTFTIGPKWKKKCWIGVQTNCGSRSSDSSESLLVVVTSMFPWPTALLFVLTE